MLPFIHIGPLQLGTYGILVATAAIVAYFVLRADLRRRRLPDISDTVVLVVTLAGIVGAKLYHVLETPSQLAADPVGEHFVWTGLARFLVEFIRINPRSVFGVLSNAQLIALFSIVAGLIILFSIRRRFKGESQERRIARHSSERGDAIQPEYHQATPECPDPQQWKMYDSMTAEVEVLEFLRSLVTTLKPKLVVETGTFMGISTLWIAEGLKRNGAGKVITCETDPLVYAQAQQRIATSGLAEWIDSRNQSSLEVTVPAAIDMLFSDSAIEVREQEVRHFLPMISPQGVILMHDASSHLKTVRDAALRLEREGLISAILLPTPRGLVLAQR